MRCYFYLDGTTVCLRTPAGTLRLSPSEFSSLVTEMTWALVTLTRSNHHV